MSGALRQGAVGVRGGRRQSGQTTIEWLVVAAGVGARCAALATSLATVAGTITDRYGEDSPE